MHMSHAIRSIVSRYIKKQSFQVLSSRLVKLSNLMRFLQVSNDSDDRIDLSRVWTKCLNQAMFAISNGPGKSRYGEIRISKMILRIGNTRKRFSRMESAWLLK